MPELLKIGTKMDKSGKICCFEDTIDSSHTPDFQNGKAVDFCRVRACHVSREQL
jgi:hypothetical protein